MSSVFSGKTIAYVANSGDGTIGRYSLDRENHTLNLEQYHETGGKVMPLVISPDQQYLYAGVRADTMHVQSFSITPNSGELTLLGTGLHFANMCFMAVDSDNRYLLAASYGDNKLSISPINSDGIVQDANQTLDTGSRAHAIQATPNNKQVIATNLGDDRLVVLNLGDELTPNSHSPVATGNNVGPRHFVFSPCGKFVYVLGELSASVTTYALNAESGELTLVSEVEGLPEGHGLSAGIPQENIEEGDTTPRFWAADIHISPDGRFIYSSERTTSSLSTFSVDTQTGKLTLVDNIKTVKQPRGFNLTPEGDYLLAAGELSDHLALYRVDSESGKLTHVSDAPVGSKANWITFMTFN